MGNQIWDIKSINWDAIGTKLKVYEPNEYFSCEVREFRERSQYPKRDFEIIRRVQESLCCQVEKRVRNRRRKIQKNSESNCDGRWRLPISCIFTSLKIIANSLITQRNKINVSWSCPRSWRCSQDNRRNDQIRAWRWNV